MGTIVHFIKIGPHIEDIATFVHQRDVNGRAAAVIGANRDIDNVLRIRAGIPWHRLRLLRTISVVHHQIQARQLRNADAFGQSRDRIGV
ncbi:hypothetical protein D3C81_2011550 [compost metagenome]